MVTDGSLSPLCHLTGQRSERLCLMSESESAKSPPSHRLKKAKGIFETQRLGTLSGRVGMQAARFFSLLSRPMESSIGWLQPLRLGLHSRQGPGALTPGGTWMDGWMDGMGRDGDGLGRGWRLYIVLICWSNNGSRHLAVSLSSHPPWLRPAPDFSPPDFPTPPQQICTCAVCTSID